MLKKIITAELKSDNIIDSKDTNKPSVVQKDISPEMENSNVSAQATEPTKVEKISKEQINDSKA